MYLSDGVEVSAVWKHLELQRIRQILHILLQMQNISKNTKEVDKMVKYWLMKNLKGNAAKNVGVYNTKPAAEAARKKKTKPRNFYIVRI